MLDKHATTLKQGGHVIVLVGPEGCVLRDYYGQSCSSISLSCASSMTEVSKVSFEFECPAVTRCAPLTLQGLHAGGAGTSRVGGSHTDWPRRLAVASRDSEFGGPGSDSLVCGWNGIGHVRDLRKVFMLCGSIDFFIAF